MGTGSGFLFDPNGNFNTGSKEFDADYSSSVNNLYQPSTKPWYMNAAPSQSMITSSLFNTFTITNDFTSSTVLTRFLSESVDFGPVYTVNTASAAVQVDITPTLITLPSPTLVLSCINLFGSPTGVYTDPPILTNSGGSVNLQVTNPAGTSVNYSASIEYLQPMNTTNHSIILGGNSTQSWVHFTGTTTGTVSTGTANITIETRAGFAGVGFVTQQRSARINLFQEIDGVFTNINPNTGTIMPAMRCLIIQSFNIQQGINEGGNQNLGDDLGGIINPVSLIP
jgi:hypothetical protein